jgi:excinuclease ABC subunit C
MCSAPCAGKIGKAGYNQDIEQLKKFLNGESEKLVKDLEQMMKYYSKNLQFENAAKLRDKINALKSLNERMSTVFYHTDTFILTKLNPSKSLEEIKKLFGLEKTPKIIDGTDISNIRGQYATGSIVRFVGGFPDKSGYRRYRIKTVEGLNDLLMMKEVVTRRLSRQIAEKDELPDILLIDGGLAHLNLVEEIVKEFKLDIFLVALAKYNDDHIYTSATKKMLKLEPKNPATQLLTFIRDEAHRFAQNYHKILRRKSIY